MIKNEKIIILGCSGSGKDFLMRQLKNLGLKSGIKYTTRPLRKDEIDGVTYNYITENHFESLANDNKFIVKQSFTVTSNDRYNEIWYYGITMDDFNKSQLFIMTPGEFEQLNDKIREKCFVVYLDIDRKIREQRLFKRNDKNDSIIRRLDADDIDFKNFKDYDLKITDPEFSAEEIYNLMN